jgi:NADPH:quinone reductase-like Zn-dependent oxidoreductase
MKAAVLIKKGSALNAFEIRDIPKPEIQTGQVLIKVAAFGLNFADVMARRGMYKEAPPLPAILGYDVAGTIDAIGAGVTGLKKGDRVTAMTRFGGYAEYAITNASAVAIIPDELDAATATALTTQYCTAIYAAAEMVNLHKGDNVLIQSGAGGVGTALIQYAKYRGCRIFATAGSESKLNYLKALGVQHAINYNTQDFEKVINDVTEKKGVDAIFDAVGGKSIKKGIRSLSPGGRIVCYGASALNGKNIFGKIITALQFGFYHPAMLMMPSKSIIGVNMLQIADHHPAIIQRCLQQVMDLYKAGVFQPSIGKVFPSTAIGEAHDFLENRMSTGKVVVQWE